MPPLILLIVVLLWNSNPFELGQIEEARVYMETVLENDPRFNIEIRRKQNLYKSQTLNEREFAAHRKAGAPEQPSSK